MADYQFYTRQAGLRKATLIITSLALSFLRLTKGPFIPTAFTTRDELLAAEADYDGYPAGGFPLAAWTGPTADPNGGAVLTSPLVNATYGPAGDPPVGNSISGFWVEDATSNVRLVGVFDPPRSLAELNQGFPIVVQIVEAVNVAPPA